MEEGHRRHLQKNRTKLIENIANPLDVVELLYEKGLFTDSMKQEVEAEKTLFAQVRKILDTVPRRGPTAFNIFYESLLESANETAADILRPELQGSHPHHSGVRGHAIPQPDMDLPTDWPNEAAMKANVVVKNCNVRSDLVRNNWISPNVYSMKKKCRGRCLILSNQNFYGPIEKDKKGIQRCILPARIGAAKDYERLSVLFTQLHFDIFVKHDLTAEQMVEELFRESSSPDHNNAECFVCIVCSHGTKTGIYGVDGNIVPLEVITEHFDGNHCRPLKGKPKLFFIQACQGEATDRPETIIRNLSGLLSNMTINNKTDSVGDTARVGDRLDAAADITQVNTVPTKADMLVACATHPGYISLRHTEYGSWFIQAVIYVFQKYSCNEDIYSLLTLVNNLIARGKTRLNNSGEANVMQASQFTTSLTKKFWFFPGIVADTEV